MNPGTDMQQRRVGGVSVPLRIRAALKSKSYLLQHWLCLRYASLKGRAAYLRENLRGILREVGRTGTRGIGEDQRARYVD